jgi:hypothetical protein
VVSVWGWLLLSSNFLSNEWVHWAEGGGSGGSPGGIAAPSGAMTGEVSRGSLCEAESSVAETGPYRWFSCSAAAPSPS